MAQLIETNQVGKREDLRDMITIVDAKNKPFLAMVPKIKKATNMLMQWQADDYDTLNLGGVADGVDVNTFENAAKDRAIVQNYCQKWRRSVMVGDIAENVSNVAGASAGEYARSIDKKLEEISRDIEATLCSANDAQLETSSAVPYKTRGLGSWIQASPTGLAATQIPAVARPPSASIDATTPITESLLRAVLKSVFTEYGNRNNLTMLVGTAVKEDISDFTAYKSDAPDTNTYSTIRSYTAPLGNKVINNVTIYEGDFNTVELHVSLLLGASTGDSAGNADTAYILPLDKYGLAFNRSPRIKSLEDQGGGPRAYIDAIAGLVSWSPRSSGKLT